MHPAGWPRRADLPLTAIRLRPEATGLFGPAAAEITDRFESLDRLVPTRLVLEQLAGAANDRDRIETLESFVATVVRSTPRPEVAFAIECLIRRGGALSIDQAHMSNDFRRLIRQSPHQWQQMAGTLGPLFVGIA